jgi:hypothetical protein
MNETDLAKKAIEYIPTRIEPFLDSTNKLKTRLALTQRDVGIVGKQIPSKEVIESSIIRLFAAQLIRESGSKVTNFSKPDDYNKAKLRVRSAIIKHIRNDKLLTQKLNRIINHRKRGIIPKINTILNKRKRHIF